MGFAVFLAALSLVAPPRVHATFPSSSTVGASWRASVSVLPPSRATLLARGPSILRAALAPAKARGRYTATLRFPAAGTWSISVAVGKRTTPVGRVTVDIAADPRVLDPFPLPAEPPGPVALGQARDP